MNTLKKYFFMACFVLLGSLVNPSPARAQGPGDPGCDPLDPACPIDGGLSLLIAAGVGIGARKAYKMKKNTAKM